MSSAVPEPSDPGIRLSCLGAATVTADRDGLPPAVLVPLGKPLALLVYLALAPKRMASRERLADLLWGDQDRTAARQSVRRALSYLRTRLGAWAAWGDDQSCFVSPHLAVDVDEFARLVNIGDYEGALINHRGDFLAGFAAPGCGQFEEWAEIERSHLRSMAARAAEAWCRQLLDRGSVKEARVAATRLREIDPSSQLGWRLLIECLLASGDRIGSMAEAARFRAWLEVESRDPDASSITMLRLAEQAEPTTGVGGAVASHLAELVGREREFSALLDTWRSAAAGETHIVIVKGSAGLGKSRLLDALAQRLRSLRKRTLVVRAYAGERALSGAFAGALVHELAALPGACGVSASVVPDLIALDRRLSDQFSTSFSSTQGPEAPAAQATALRELIASVCDEAPLALLLDDAHWFDPASARLFTAALSRLRHSPLLVVIASRADLHDVGSDERATRMELQPLAAEDVRALVASMGVLPADEELTRFLVARVSGASRGIPLLVLSAIDQLRTEGLLELCEGSWAVPDEARLRDRLRNIDALATRIRALPPATFSVLLACGMAGRPLPTTILEKIEHRLDPSGTALQYLEGAGYLRRGPLGDEVAHDAVAEAACDVATDQMRAEAARALGLELVATGEDYWVECGIKQLASAGDVEALRAPIAQLARRHTVNGRTTPSDFVATITGLSATGSVVRDIVSTLPMRTRFRHMRTRALIVSLPVFAAVTFAATKLIAGSAATDAPALEIVAAEGAGAVRTAVVPLDRSTWIRGDPLLARFGPAHSDTTAVPLSGMAFRPGTHSWAVATMSPDTGEVDVALVDAATRVHRLTWSHADEIPYSWSPDGRQLIILTSAFSATKFKTIGILDVAAGRVRRWGPTTYPVGNAAWSPNGTSIAYTISRSGTESHDLCVAPLTGDQPDCQMFGDRIEIAGWLTGSKLLLHTGGPPGNLAEYEVASHRIVPVGVDSISRADLSPDGHWVAFSRDAPSSREFVIAPADRLLDQRVVTTVAPMALDAQLMWSGTFAQREFVDTVAIEAPTDSIPLGSSFRLSVRATSNTGRTIDVGRHQWTSLTPRVAAVDSDGVVTPVAPGPVVIEVSAGGWRSKRRSFVVTARAPDTLLTEAWNDPFSKRWVPFGIPLPVILHDARLGNAFLNNGDGRYFSGAYLPRRLDGRGGLALDGVVSLPVTREQGQYFELSFEPLRAVARLRAEWDHRTGYIPAKFVHRGGTSCELVFPAREGTDAPWFAAPLGRLTPSIEGGLSRLARGFPTRVRIQVFPDGRCGVAVEGERPFVATHTLLGVDSLYLVAQGNSQDTRLLLGPVIVRRGVPAGVDWGNRRKVWVP